jgi:hypothetical protein
MVATDLRQIQDPLVTVRSETVGMERSRSRRNILVAALGVALIAIGLVSLISRPLVGAAYANGFGGPPWAGGAGWQGGAGWHGGDWAANLPPELAGLADVPADQRFAHFRGVQVQLTDKNNNPLRVDVTPGTVTAASATSLTISGNDGASHTYTLDNKTLQRGQALKPNDHVVVATINGSATATGVFGADGGFGPRGFGGGPWH